VRRTATAQDQHIRKQRRHNKENNDMTTNINQVTVLGTGVLGSQIAYQTAYRGLEVTAYDISEEILDRAKATHVRLAALYEEQVDGASDGPARDALARLTYSSNLADAVSDADLVIESVPERLDVKRDVYAQLAQLAPQRTIFATNSSTLLPSQLADSTGRPDRFLALHFANQIWTHNTAEIMGHAGTDPAVHNAMVHIARRIGMVPIPLHKEQPGYIVNSLLVPLLQAAQTLAVKGIAEPETIDNAWRIATGAPTGPFEVLDVVGLTTAYNIAAAGDVQSRANARYLKDNYIDKGKLGRASGEGFYRYDTAMTARK
jgi:3-hydroxybutyryl-CoA dehydrogenase